MLIKIFIILAIFIIAFTAVWVWYFKYEFIQTYQRLYLEGLKAFRSKEYERAIELFKKTVKMKSNFQEAFYRLGLAYFKLKDYVNAKENFETALKMAPKDFPTLYHFALTLQMQDMYEEAIGLYNRAIAENSRHKASNFNLAKVYFLQKNWQKALETFEKTLEISPDDPETLFWIVKCKDSLCKYESEEEGQEIINEYLAFENSSLQDETFELSLATAYAKMGNINQAIKHCQKHLSKHTEHIECYKLLGLMQLIKKDLKGAKSTLSTALSLDASNEEVHDILSYVLCQQKNKCSVKKCREKYREIIEKFIKIK